LKIVEAINI